MRSELLLGALAFDFFVGEPPAAVHPVVWMGRLIGAFDARRPESPGRQRAWGVALMATGVGASFGATWAALAALNRLSPPARLIGASVLLKTTFAVRQLAHGALDVRRHLDRGDLTAARRALRHLVSRPTADLTPVQVVAATIESVAENTADSVIAPLFWFLLLGIPGAMAYRFVNTADAMIGYRGRYEQLGWAAAKLDDAANWLPARTAAALLVVASWLTGRHPRRAWQVAWRDHGRTASPNAGWPMATAAGALGVQLEKLGQYRLGDGPESKLVPTKIAQAVSLMLMATSVAVLAVLVLHGLFPSRLRRTR